MEEKESAWKSSNDRLKSQLQTLNRELKEHQSTISNLKGNLNRSTERNNASEGKIEELLSQLKKLQSLYETKLDNLSLENSYECDNLLKENRDLRETID